MAITQYSTPTLDEHVKAIGWLCIKWAHIELMLNQFIILLTPIYDEDIQKSLTSNMSMSDKIKVVDALTFIRRPSDGAHEAVRSLLNMIDNELRPERNKCVHDFWGVGAEGAIRTHEKSKIKKPQANQPLELITHETVLVSSDEIWGLVTKVNETTAALMTSYVQYHKHMTKPSVSSQ